MNKRIKDLARLAQNATAAHFGDRWSSIGRAEFMMIYNQKFAEEIVRECVLEAMDAQHHNTSIRLQLYKHFGVE